MAIISIIDLAIQIPFPIFSTPGFHGIISH
jgi:hypothetical protein